MNAKLLRTCIVALCVLATTAAQAEDFTAAPLRVPEGYEVELAAAPPLVAHPLMGDFDEEGRLYLAASAGENLPRAELEARLPNFVQRLEDTDGDGVFDRATTFADKMTFPQGCLWYQGSLYVASSGAIWKLTDTNDDGVADERVKLVSDFGYTGNAADVHGPFLGPDGRIYWCEGRHGHEIKDSKGQLISRGKAARIFSCGPDGSDVQTFCTGGMDNPVEVVFDAQGEMLGTVNLMYDRPRGDCLVHWQHGGVYPRVDFAESLGTEFTRTGSLLPEVHNFGHVAVSGLCLYRGQQFPQAARGALFITEFNTHRLVMAKLKPQASSFAVDKLEDFAVSTSNDFHPTDVLEDADGSLLLIDTGGWFRIGCPQSQVAKSHVRGAIYRIRRTDAARVEDPRGKRLDWKSPSFSAVIERLADKRPAVVDRAASWLALHLNADSTQEQWQECATTARNQPPSARQKWANVLARVASKPSLKQLVNLARDADGAVRQTAVRALLYADAKLLPADNVLIPRVLSEINSDSPAARRIAIATAGRLSSQRPKLAAALVSAAPVIGEDRLLDHALTYALISSANRAAVNDGLFSASESMRASAAMALEVLRQPRSNVSQERWLEVPAPAQGKSLSNDERKQLLDAEASLPAGDVERGKTLFATERAACAQCHRVGKQGGQVGPDLSTIGRSRASRDLLEAMLYPSASFARGFAPYAVVTKDGKSLSGIILGESATQIRLGSDAKNATWIMSDNVEEIHASELSIMPTDVAKRLSPQEVADLIAYLRALQ